MTEVTVVVAPAVRLGDTAVGSNPLPGRLKLRAGDFGLLRQTRALTNISHGAHKYVSGVKLVPMV